MDCGASIELAHSDEFGSEDAEIAGGEQDIAAVSQYDVARAWTY
jgi:hypothetical protein